MARWRGSNAVSAPRSGGRSSVVSSAARSNAAVIPSDRQVAVRLLGAPVHLCIGSLGRLQAVLGDAVDEGPAGQGDGGRRPGSVGGLPARGVPIFRPAAAIEVGVRLHIAAEGSVLGFPGGGEQVAGLLGPPGGLGVIADPQVGGGGDPPWTRRSATVHASPPRSAGCPGPARCWPATLRPPTTPTGCSSAGTSGVGRREAGGRLDPSDRVGRR